MNNCDNSWQIVKYLNEARINYTLNPSAETTGNFSAVGGATVTRSTTFQKYGLYSYRIQAGVANDGISLTLGTLTNSNHTVSVRVRNLAKGSLIAQIGTGQHTFQLVEKIDKQWNLYKAEFSAGEANGETNLNILASTNVDVYIDGVQVEPGQLTTYIDGTQDGCEWLGAEHEAISRRSAASKLGGEPVDFFEEYGFRVKSVKDAGAAPVRLGIDSYAILPGGELNSKKIEPRSFIMRGQFIADSEEELHDKRQALRKEFEALNNQPTPIRFNGGKVQKEILVQYAGGLEGDIPAFYGPYSDEDDDKIKQHSKFTEDVVIELQSPNPFWYEVGESSAILDTLDSATFRYVAGRLRSTGQWDVLGPPGAGGTYTLMAAIAEDDTYVYIGGSFSNFDGIAAADNIVRWHKQDQVYSALGSGANGSVLDMALSDDGKLYVTGAFTTLGGSTANRVGYWDTVTETWNAMSTGLGAIGHALTIGLDGTVYITGQFTTPHNYVTSWNGIGFAGLGSGFDAEGSCATTRIDGHIFFGGSFTTAGGSGAAGVVEWNPDAASFSALSSGSNGSVASCFADPDDGRVYFGGSMTSLGSVAVGFWGVWNGTSFSALGGGVDDSAVETITKAPGDSVIYLGGGFTSAAGIALNDRMARWNGYSYAHVDIDLPGSALVAEILASKFIDPVVRSKYDIFIVLGFGGTGTGTFAGLTTITNNGTVSTFPKIVFTRTGGQSAIVESVRNETTGREILFNYGLRDGESLVVDLAPTKQTVISLPSALSKKGAILAGSGNNFTLQPGDNDISAFVNYDQVLYPAEIEAYLLWRDPYDGYD